MSLSEGRGSAEKRVAAVLRAGSVPPWANLRKTRKAEPRIQRPRGDRRLSEGYPRHAAFPQQADHGRQRPEEGEEDEGFAEDRSREECPEAQHRQDAAPRQPDRKKDWDGPDADLGGPEGNSCGREGHDNGVENESQ